MNLELLKTGVEQIVGIHAAGEPANLSIRYEEAWAELFDTKIPLGPMTRKVTGHLVLPSEDMDSFLAELAPEATAEVKIVDAEIVESYESWIPAYKPFVLRRGQWLISRTAFRTWVSHENANLSNLRIYKGPRKEAVPGLWMGRKYRSSGRRQTSPNPEMGRKHDRADSAACFLSGWHLPPPYPLEPMSLSIVVALKDSPFSDDTQRGRGDPGGEDFPHITHCENQSRRSQSQRDLRL